MSRLDILKHNTKQILIAVDQLCNPVFCLLTNELVYADETMSAHAWRWHKNNKRHWPMKLIDTLFFWDKNHCYESYLSEILGRQLPPEYRKQKSSE